MNSEKVEIRTSVGEISGRGKVIVNQPIIDGVKDIPVDCSRTIVVQSNIQDNFVSVMNA